MPRHATARRGRRATQRRGFGTATQQQAYRGAQREELTDETARGRREIPRRSDVAAYAAPNRVRRLAELS
jgi:hypothetical protein